MTSTPPTPTGDADPRSAVVDALHHLGGLAVAIGDLARPVLTAAPPAGPVGTITATGVEHLVLSSDGTAAGDASLTAVTRMLTPPSGQVWLTVDLPDCTVQTAEALVRAEPDRFPSVAAFIRQALAETLARDDAARRAREAPTPDATPPDARYPQPAPSGGPDGPVAPSPVVPASTPPSAEPGDGR